jgi:hypothetical protein
MPPRYSVSSGPLVTGAQRQSFQSSAGTGSGLQKYHEHTQTIGGTWRRRWVYNEPTPGVSSAPTVAYSYIELFIDESVIQKFITADFSATFQQMHDIEYWSDSTLGGWGTSGVFYTNKAGIIRKLFATGDTEDTCVKSFTTNAATQMGPYEASLDTSSNFNAQFFNDVLTEAVNKCPRFNIQLVEV